MKLFKKISLSIIILLLSLNAGTIRFVKACNINEYENKSELEIKSTNDFKVTARNAIAIDSKTKEVLWEQRGYDIVPMASTTKILTSLVAINYGDLDRIVTISKNASAIRGSTVGYSAGEEVTMRELLFGLMFRSGNDAAIAIAEDIGGSVENFSNIMNDFAKSIGIIDSNFESPHGLDSKEHYSSAYDLALLTAKAMENEFFREIAGEKIISKDKYNFTREYQNINKILYRIPEANGVKTGYTGQAGKCLVSSMKYGDRNIIIVVLNCSDRWNQTEKIYKYIKENNSIESDTLEDNMLLEESFTSLGKIIDDDEVVYGYKKNEKLDLEVFNNISGL